MQHDLLISLMALFVCSLGSVLMMRLFVRAQDTSGLRRKIQVLLASLVAGTTIWATHSAALISFPNVLEPSFSLSASSKTLVLGILGTGIAFLVATARKGRVINAAAGAVFGLTIVTMQFFGMNAISINGALSFDLRIVALSIATSMICGSVVFYRLSLSVSPFSWIRCASYVIVTILLVHWMTVFSWSYAPSAFLGTPENNVGRHTLEVWVTTVVSAVLFLASITFLFEAHLDRETQELLKDAAMQDSLTDLPNRQRMKKHFQRLRKDTPLGEVLRAGVITFDIDNFKNINEMHGNAMGDGVLRAYASKLASLCSQNEFAARTGPDQFIVVMHPATDTAAVEVFIEEFLALVKSTFQVNGVIFKPSTSVGYAMCPADGQDLDALLLRSELAMTRAKAIKNGQVQRFDPTMDQQEREQDALMEDLRQSLDRGQLSLNYQLQNHIGNEEVCGLEVLVRWRHHERGKISPAVFIPMAESSGFIRELGLWVLKTACIEAATWHKRLPIAVNVAPQQLLQPQFVETVEQILVETGLAPSRLELEITEASIIEDQENTLAVMHGLRKMGIRIAMDDFGTGYSSLAMLQAFPFDKIKIDRSFVTNVHENPERAAIIQATVLIGEAMAIPVLVEGVELIEELTFLRRAKCNIVQGFIFGKPLEVEQVRQLTVYSDEQRVSGWQ